MDRFVISAPRVTLSWWSDSSAFSETADANPDVDANKPAAEAPAKRKRDKSRKYSETYLKLGFTYKDTGGIELPVLCYLFSCTVKRKHETIEAAASFGGKPWVEKLKLAETFALQLDELQ